MNSEIITSLDNPMIKEARSLLDKKFRKFYGKFLVDGEKLVNEVVCGAMEVDKLFVDSSKLANFNYILEKFDGKIVPVTEKVMNSISENATPQGIIAEVFMRETVEFNPNKNKPILILDRIQDPGNLGTIIRTASATGFETIVLIDTADPYSPKVVRSSSGGIFYLDIFRMSEVEILDYIKTSNHKLLIADMDGKNVFSLDANLNNFALVIGNEGQGVSDSFKKAGEIISLPMKPQMESLNAAVSASVLMYTLVGKNL
ncbi:MAG: RNA methyltransferase [Clostridia bacterium]|nr:RNA methyltransferase [Clostridia bacterium]